MIALVEVVVVVVKQMILPTTKDATRAVPKGIVPNTEATSKLKVVL